MANSKGRIPTSIKSMDFVQTRYVLFLKSHCPQMVVMTHHFAVPKLMKSRGFEKMGFGTVIISAENGHLRNTYFVLQNQQGLKEFD